MGETVLEIGIDGKVDGRAERGEMIADLVDRDAVIRLADRPGETGAGRASALKPICASAFAEPMSKGLGIEKQPLSCSLRNVARLSANEIGIGVSPFCCL